MSNLEKHIQRHHNKEYASIMNHRAEKRLKLHGEISRNTSLPKQQQQMISNYMEKMTTIKNAL